MKYLQKFTVHPVGQGLFYSGEIDFDMKNAFRFVFDCGSRSYEQQRHVALDYRNKILNSERKVIDVLVLSHFDSDHINLVQTLLEDDIKVKCLVMPFISFGERLLLSIKAHDPKNPDQNSLLDLILDPIETLSSSISENGEIYIVTSDPDRSIPAENEYFAENNNLNQNTELFNVYTRSSNGNFSEETRSSDGTRVTQGEDTFPVQVYQEKSLAMEFLFYRRAIGKDAEDFYLAFEDVFYQELLIDKTLDWNEKRDKLVEAVKMIKKSETVKDIISRTLKKLSNNVEIMKTAILDMNTTALCMLHLNRSISVDRENGLYTNGITINGFFKSSYIDNVDQKERMEIKDKDDFAYCEPPQFPNTMLTSDSFILEEADVNAFKLKYRHYMDKFWLLQVPHHGSKRNADLHFFKATAATLCHFINHGEKRSWPHAEITNLLISNARFAGAFRVFESQSLTFTNFSKKGIVGNYLAFSQENNTITLLKKKEVNYL